MSNVKSDARRIVILGGGFAGAYCAKALERNLRNTSIEVFLIDRRNYFVFYPLLIEAGTGGIEPRHAVIPLRPFLTKTHFHTGDVARLDASGQKITTRCRERTGCAKLHTIIL